MELLEISVLCGVGILVVLGVSHFLRKTYTAFWRYCLWVLIGIRLILPFDFSLPGRSVVIPLPVRVTAEGKMSDASSGSEQEGSVKTEESYPAEYVFDIPRAEDKTGSNQTGNDKTGNGGLGGNQIYSDSDKDAKAANLKTGDLSNQDQQEKAPQETGAWEQNSDMLNRLLWWASLIWAIVVIALFVWQAACYALFSHKVKGTKIFYGKKEKLSVYTSSVVSSPMLMGIRKPQIVLPDREYKKEELAFILEHEFTHYKRKDLWAKLLLALAKTLHWFNPLVIWMERQAIQDMELLCDSRVVKHFSREEKKQYGTALLNCASSEKNRITVLCTSEFSRDVKTLKKRFANIFYGEGKKKGVLAVVLGAVLLLSVSLFVMFGTSENDAEKVSRKSENPVPEEMDADAQKNGEKIEKAGSGKQVENEDLANGQQGEEQQEKGQLGDDSLFSLMHTYNWQEITISIPDAWEGKYQVEEAEDGFSLMQKASYENEKGMGMLCSFGRADGMVIDYAGATPLAFTDTQTYYMTEPTDVNYDYEDVEIAKEYREMYDLVKAVAATVTIDKEGVKENPEEYVLPLSSTALLKEEYLFNFSDNELKIARNEIYARHGRQFENPYLAAYFDSCSWYEGTVPAEEFDEGMLSQTERENLMMIQKAEEAYKTEHPYPKEYQSGIQASEDLDKDGKAETVSCIFGEEDTSIVIDGTEFALSDIGVQLFTPNTAVFYVTDIVSYDDELEIALLDYGPSDDYETHFFSYQGSLHYLGSVSGFPFAQQTGHNGFVADGFITGEYRIDFTHTSHVYDSWWYDQDGRKLVQEESGYYKFVPERAHALSEDLTVYQEMNETHMKNVLPAQDKVFFLETDGKEWVLVKGKDGTKGYMHIVDGKISGLSKAPGEVFSGLDFVD